MTGFVALILSTTTAILRHIGSWRIRTFRQRLCEDLEPLETLRRRQKHCEALESLILNLSDQQLVTSFILLILAYTKYVAPSIYLDPAHSSIACNSSIANLPFTGDLVFYSSVTHATTLITLRTYLKKRVLQTILRILVVYFTFGMWLAIKITGYSVNFPRFGDLPTTGKFQQVTNVCEVVGLAIVYLDIFIPISTDLFLSLQNYMRVKRSFNTIKDWAEFSFSFRNHKFRHRAFLPRCLILLWVLFGISSVNLLLDENYQPQVFTIWGFGQLLSICLLILPFLTLAEKFEGRLAI